MTPAALAGADLWKRLGAPGAGRPRRLRAGALADLFGYFAEAAALELPVADMLDMAARSASDGRVRAVLRRARAALRRGAGLSAAFAQTGAVPAFAVQLLRVAEASGAPGALGEAFAALREHYRTQAELAGRLRRAVVQPAITATLVLGVALFVFTVLVPRLRPLFAVFREAPAVSRWVFAAADLVSQHLAVVGLAVGGLLAAGWRWRDRALGLVPVLRHVTAAVEAYQVCASLALLLRAELPVSRAVALAADGIGGRVGAELERARRRVANGLPLSAALAAIGLRAEALEAIRKGEQLGQVAQALGKAAWYYRRYLDQRCDTLAQTLGLGATFAAAAMLALVAMTVFLPIYAAIGSASLAP